MRKNEINWKEHPSYEQIVIENLHKDYNKILGLLVKEAKKLKDTHSEKLFNVSRLKRKIRTLKESTQSLKDKISKELANKKDTLDWKVNNSKYEYYLIDNIDKPLITIMEGLKDLALSDNNHNFVNNLKKSAVKRRIRLILTLSKKGDKQITKEDREKVISYKQGGDFVYWETRGGYYEKALVKYYSKGWSKKEILEQLKMESLKNKDFNFNLNITLGKIGKKISLLKKDKEYGDIVKQSSFLNKQEYLEKKIELEMANDKQKKQHLFLNRHGREENSIENTRGSILQALFLKSQSNNDIFKQGESIFKKDNTVKEKKILQHIITDLHLNETIDPKKRRKGNYIPNLGEWNTSKGLDKVTEIFNQLIQKQIDSKNTYDKLEILFLGDMIGTEIHEGLNVDIESIRAARFLASHIAKIYHILIKNKYFKSVSFVAVPGNHSETRKYGEKTDTFHENYDFIFAQYLKEFLILMGKPDALCSPDRNTPLIINKIGEQSQGFGHGDRFGGKYANMKGVFERNYGTSYFNYYHQGHLHKNIIKFEDGFLKQTYPCVCPPSDWAKNRFGVGKNQELQVGNIFDNNGNILETYYLEEGKTKEYLKDVTYDLDFDLAEIFQDTYSLLKKNNK